MIQTILICFLYTPISFIYIYIHIICDIDYNLGNCLLSQACCFLARPLFIFIIFFFSSFFFFSYLLSFPFPFFPFLSYLSFVHFLSLLSFFSFSLWKGRADEGAHYLVTSNHKVNEKRMKMVSRKNGDEITESHNAKNF